jgi:magnesium dechelatase
MSQLNPNKLHVQFLLGAEPSRFQIPRRYTLTHSDSTGDLFLTIGKEFDREQISGWYTRLMRDEVLAEWRATEETPEFHVFCHVSGGIVIGTAAWRYNIFQTHMRQVLQAFRHGDSHLILAHPELDQSPVRVHFNASQSNFRQIQDLGFLGDYALLIKS